MTDLSAADYRQAMRAFATGVAIVACGEGGARAGCVATALASLSLAPPSLIVNLQREGTTARRLREVSHFSVNLLAADQEEIARRFAGGPQAQRFAAGTWTRGATGAPVLAGGLAVMECRVEEMLERHTHVIVIGEVERARTGADAPALLHFGGRWRRT